METAWYQAVVGEQDLQYLVRMSRQVLASCCTSVCGILASSSLHIQGEATSCGHVVSAAMTHVCTYPVSSWPIVQQAPRQHGVVTPTTQGG